MFLSDKLYTIIKENKHNNRLLAEKLKECLHQEIDEIEKLQDEAQIKCRVTRMRNALNLALKQNPDCKLKPNQVDGPFNEFLNKHR